MGQFFFVCSVKSPEVRCSLNIHDFDNLGRIGCRVLHVCYQVVLQNTRTTLVSTRPPMVIVVNFQKVLFVCKVLNGDRDFLRTQVSLKVKII